jgi:acyl homoserine lactone synthase
MTVDCFNYETAHLYGDALASQFRLRHRVFIERQAYNVPSHKGMEYYQFDNPAAQYFVWRDNRGVARGVARLAPTSVNYMLEEVWPHMVQDIGLPKSDRVWEGTRFGVDRDLDPKQRNTIVKELVCAYIEYAILNGIDDIIGVMPVGIWRAVFARNGWKSETIGPVWREDGIDLVAAKLPCSLEVLHTVRRRTQASNVLQILGTDHFVGQDLEAA